MVDEENSAHRDSVELSRVPLMSESNLALTLKLTFIQAFGSYLPGWRLRHHAAPGLEDRKPAILFAAEPNLEGLPPGYIDLADKIIIDFCTQKASSEEATARMKSLIRDIDINFLGQEGLSTDIREKADIFRNGLFYQLQSNLGRPEAAQQMESRFATLRRLCERRMQAHDGSSPG